MTAPPNRIRLLVADDDPLIIRCYERAFSRAAAPSEKALESLATELFGPNTERLRTPAFDLVTCRQGGDALDAAAEAISQEDPFDAVILDVRMPPGINGVAAGEKIRRLDPDVPIVFVSGYSDVPEEELGSRIPPPSKLYYYRKPVSFGELALDVTGFVYARRSADLNDP